MATNVKKGNKFKENYNKAKTGISNWNSAIKKAYSVGYAAGYNANSKIPNKFGTRNVAVQGFSKGLQNARRTDKYVKN